MLPNLYALRFILAILVVIFHIPGVSKTLGFPFYGDQPIFHKGHLAVLYFFTLSGFLIIRLIYLEITKSKTFDFKTFYLRRIQRLYPVYYLVFFIGLLLYHVILPKLNIHRAIDYSLSDLLLYYVFFIPNIFSYHYTPGSILNILWSIGVEEQFYLFIPPLLYLGRKNVIRTMIVLLIIALGIFFIYTDLYKYKNFYFYFLFGGLCAIVSEKHLFSLFKNKITHLVVYTAFILSYVTDVFTYENVVLHHSVNMVISGLTITLITYYAIFKIEYKFLNYLGKISYGIYMYHMIVITGLFFVADKLHLTDVLNDVSFIVLFNLTSIIVTAIVSHLSYKYFEKLFYTPRI